MTAAAERLETLRRGVLGNVFGRGVQMCLMLLSSIVLARLLGLEGLGQYAIVAAAVRIATVPLVEGVARLCEREISGALATGAAALAAASVRFAGLGTGLYVFVGGAGLIAFLRFAPQAASSPLDLAAIACLLLAIDGVVAGLRGIVRGEGQTASAQVPAIVGAALMPTCFLVYFVVTGDLSVEAALLLRAAAQGLTIPVWAFFAIRHWPAGWRLNMAGPIPRGWIEDSAQFTVLGAVQVMLSEIGVILTGAFGTAADAGLFRIATRVYMVANFLTQITRNVVGPRVAPAWRVGDTDALQRTARDLSSLAFAFTVVMTVAFAVLGVIILELAFGSDFVGAYIPGLILCLAAVVQSTGSIGGRILKMSGFQLWVTAGSVLGLALIIATGILLIPGHGASGAALAFLFGAVASQVVFVVTAWRQMRINVLPDFRSMKTLQWRHRIGHSTLGD